MVRRALIALLIVMITSSALASDPAINRASKLIEVELRYRDGIELLERTLREQPIEDRDRVEAYRLLAVAYVARGAMGSATASFARLLEIDPSFELDPLASPKIREAFTKAKASQKPPETAPVLPPPVTPPPIVDPEPPPPAKQEPPLVIAPAPIEEESPPIFSRWWFWAAVVVVAGAGVGTAIVLSNGDSPPTTGTLDPIQLD